MWFLFQSLIIFAVMASNIHWEWTPNGYLASLIAGGLAILATVVINELRAWKQSESTRTARKQ